MKKLFISMLAVAALASCSNEQTLELNPGEAISFGNAFIENATRATVAADPSYSTTTGKGVALTAFDVYGAVNGVNIFNGNQVSKGDAAYNAAWTLTGPPQYWIAGASYVFDAVVDATTVTTSTATGLPTSLNYVVSGQKDMLHARVSTTGKPNDTGVVAFTFSHLLSKVKFSVRNTTDGAATNYRFNITDVKLTNVYASGDYAVPAGTWSNQTSADYVLEDLIVNSAATQYHSKEVLLIPGSAIGVYIKADIEAQADGTNWTKVSEVEKTFNAALGTDKVLVANTAYNFVVEMGIGEEIKFTATEMPSWIEPTASNGGNVTLN